MQRFTYYRRSLLAASGHRSGRNWYTRSGSAAPHSQPGVSYALAFKRPIEVALAIILVVMAAPLLLVLALLAVLDGGPAFYGHLRMGRHGREFRCLKLRSMRVDGAAVLASHLASCSEARLEWETHGKLHNDPRVTRLGRILRRTSLDELPQLLNVLRGDMSLIGPRPVVSSELARYYGPDATQAYCSVRPGVTGLWQVSGRSDVSYDKRVVLDTRYARNVSLSLDCSILLKTFGVVLLGRGAR